MKTKLFLGVFTLLCLIHQKSQSQWMLGGNSGVGATDYIGSTNTASFKIITNNTQKVIVLGNSGATDGYVGIGTTSPSSVLHIDGSGLASPTGDVFRTTTSTSVDHTWKMFSGSTEMFRIENSASSNGIKLMGLSSGAMRLYSQGTQRIYMGPNAANGFVGMGNNFSDPQSRLHIHQGGAGNNVQLQLTTNGTSNTTAADGLTIGVIDNTLNAEFKQNEFADMLFYTTDASPATIERVRIKSNGNVGIGTASPTARLHIIPETPTGTVGSIDGIKVECDGNNLATNVIGVNINVEAANGSGIGSGAACGIIINSVSTDAEVVGIDSRAFVSKAGANPLSSSLGGYFLGGVGNSNGAATTMGVFGYASGAYNNIFGINTGGYFEGTGTTETNYGVRGYANGGTNNYGVWGETVSSSGCTPGSGTCSNAAGYFNGNLIYTQSFGALSDSKFKHDINTIDSASCFLSQIQPHSYFYDTASYPQINLPVGKHYGVIAQELEAILPGLVNNYIHPGKKDSAGNVIYNEVEYKAVNYIELITILIAGHQNQQARIDSLSQLFSLFTDQRQGGQTNPVDQSKKLEVTLTNKLGVILNQNDPNPFKENTVITYFIPEEVKHAKIIFHNLNGIILKTVDITEKGEGAIEVFASDLSSGIYTYSILADGNLIDTKRMIKTK